MPMSATARAVENQRAFSRKSALALLHRPNAPVVLGVLAEHFGEKRRIYPSAELHALIEADLEDLNVTGAVSMPRTSQAYCKDWVDQGYLVRRSGATARSEEYSLSEAAQKALRIIDQEREQRGAATQSRLTLLSSQLRRLAEETDPDAGRRVEALAQERERLRERISAIEAGHIDVMPAQRAVEAAEELFGLASEVPGDFVRVQGSIERLHRDLRLQLIEHDGPQGEVLDSLFLGVDTIDASDEGRSFAAFHALLMDPVQGLTFNEAVDALASRPFARDFGIERIHYLQTYLRRLQRDSHEVRSAMTDLSRSLREFVRSRQFEQFRALADALRRPQRQALEVAQRVRLHTRTSVELELTTFQPRSVGQLHLHVPSETTVTQHARMHTATPIDLEALRATVRESEIDLAELIDAVNATVRARSTMPVAGPVSIAQIAEAHPLTQGLASVVGLLVLGARHGTPRSPETVSWSTRDGRHRHALITSFEFTMEIT